MARRRKRSRFSVLFGTRVIVWSFAFLLLFLGAVMIVQGRIDKKALRTQVIQTLKEKTGQDVVVKGEVSVRLLPRPVAYITGLEILNPKNSGDEKKAKLVKPELTADLVVLSLDMGTLLDKVPQVKGIAMQRPMLVLQRGEDNYIQWGWLDKSFIKNMFSHDVAAHPYSLKFVEGRVAYREQNGDEFFSVDSITMEGATGNKPFFEGEGLVEGRIVQFLLDGNVGDTKLAEGATPLNLKLFTDAKNMMQVKGGLVYAGDTPKIDGIFTLMTDNLYPWVYGVDAAANEAAKLSAKQAAKLAASRPVYPLQLSGNWSQEGDSVEIKDAQVQGLNSAGSGVVGLRWAGWRPDLQIDLRMKAFDYNKWEALLHDVIAGKLADSKPKNSLTYTSENQATNPLPQNLNMLVYLDIENLILGTQTLEDTQIQAALADGALTVNQFNIQMPGKSELTLFGVISPGSTGGLRFEGSMEMQGKSLREMLTVFEDTASELPAASFGEFFTRSNIFISSEQLRLSEAQTKINDLQLSGGLVAYFDTTPRVEADVRLKDINFDYFRDVWRDSHKQAAKGDYFLKFDKGTNYSWLRKIKASVDFRVAVEGFKLFDKQGDTASFRLFARQNELGMYNVRMTYPTSELDANLSVNVRNNEPLFTVVLNTDELNTEYFLPLKKEPAAPKEEATGPKKYVWSEELVDLSGLEGYAASYDFTINKLIHGDLTVDNVKFQGKLENGSLSFKNTSFSYWDGKCSVSGILYGGKVPGMNTSFTMYNLQLRDVLKSMTGHDNISGRVSLTGALSTTGVNFLSWASQADANISLSGRNISVDGLNLRGVVDVVKVSRTAADVFNNANLALRNGTTDFTLDGSLNVKNGSVKTPGITMKSNLASGTFNGEVKLVPWRLDSSTLFYFQTLSTENVPTLTLQLTGPLEAPQLRSDTASLEAYVAKQIVGH